MEVLNISLWVVVVLIMVALAFDFMNGFHDAANSIATVVSTRVLKPHQAVLMAAFFNFAALFVFHFQVATTVGSGIIDQGIVDHYVVFGALVGAIIWNIVTWYYGIPSSSSHALIGGLVGAAVAKAGTWALIPAGIWKTGGLHRDVAFAGLPARVAADARRVVDFRALDAEQGGPPGSGACSSCRRRSTASGTAATTRRRPPASSGCC